MKINKTYHDNPFILHEHLKLIIWKLKKDCKSSNLLVDMTGSFNMRTLTKTLSYIQTLP